MARTVFDAADIEGLLEGFAVTLVHNAPCTVLAFAGHYPDHIEVKALNIPAGWSPARDWITLGLIDVTSANPGLAGGVDARARPTALGRHVLHQVALRRAREAAGKVAA